MNVALALVFDCPFQHHQGRPFVREVEFLDPRIALRLHVTDHFGVVSTRLGHDAPSARVVLQQVIGQGG